MRSSWTKRPSCTARRGSPAASPRHKALDLIGDLALMGRPLKALIVAHRAGHALHTQLVTRLLGDRTLWTETTDERGPAGAATRSSLSVSATSRIEAD